MPIQARDPKYTKQQKEFLQFVNQELEDSRKLEELIKYCLFQAGIVLAQPHNTLRRKLKEKIGKGTQEYGSPVYDPYRLLKEFEEECIDLLGWRLVEMWNVARRKSGIIEE